MALENYDKICMWAPGGVKTYRKAAGHNTTKRTTSHKIHCKMYIICSVNLVHFFIYLFLLHDPASDCIICQQQCSVVLPSFPILSPL